MKRKIGRSAQEMIGGVLRKVPLAGVGEIRLPSDIRRIIVSNVENLRENALAIFAKEVSRVLSKVDTQHIVDQVLKNYSLRVEARLDLVPKSRSPKKKGRK